VAIAVVLFPVFRSIIFQEIVAVSMIAHIYDQNPPHVHVMVIVPTDPVIKSNPVKISWLPLTIGVIDHV
jgi:hypothetical protein